MRKYLFACLVAVSIAFSGCSTGAPDKPSTPEEQQQNEDLRAARIAIVVKNTARDLVIYGNSQDPERTLKATGIALDALNVVLGDSEGQVTPDKIRQALVDAGFDKLDSPEAMLALGTLTTTYELFWAEYINGKITNYENVTKVAEALRDGVKAGRDAITAPSV